MAAETLKPVDKRQSAATDFDDTQRNHEHTVAAVEHQVMELVLSDLIWECLRAAVQQQQQPLYTATQLQSAHDDMQVARISATNITVDAKSKSLDRYQSSTKQINDRLAVVQASPQQLQKTDTNLSIATTASAQRVKVLQQQQETSSRIHSAPTPNFSMLTPTSAGGMPVVDEDQLRKMKKEARQRKKHRTDNDDKVAVGERIGEGHANFVLMYDMLTGIRIAVSRCVAKPQRDVQLADFSAKHKLTFDVLGNELTPSSKYDFKFKDYAPWVFRHIREHFKIEAADYLVSLTGKYVLSELGSPGKSGSFFYFSQDYRFIIKTIHRTEHKFMMRIMSQYYDHIKSNANTLLSRYLGLHRVKLPQGRKIYFVVMGNVFPPNKDIHETYDLKGSLVGREVSREDIKTRPRVVQKDLNWCNSGKVMQLGPDKRQLLVAQMQKDVALLISLNIMDYSLLTGIHYLKRGNSENIRDKSLQVFEPSSDAMTKRPQSSNARDAESALKQAIAAGADTRQTQPSSARFPEEMPSERKGSVFYRDDGGFLSTDEHNRPLLELYYVGIIDILTPYNYAKVVEHYWKSLTLDKDLISAVDPVKYGRRFLDFMVNKVVSNFHGGGTGALATIDEHVNMKTVPDGGDK